MKRVLLVGGLLAAAGAVALLAWPRSSAGPIETAAAPAAAASATAPAPAPQATAASAPQSVSPAPGAPAASMPPGMAPPAPGPATAANTFKPSQAPPLTKQEKLEGLAPAVPDLEQRVARLRKEADEEEKQGHADAAKEKRVAADRSEKRLGEIRASLAEGKLPPGFFNSSSSDKSKE